MLKHSCGEGMMSHQVILKLIDDKPKIIDRIKPLQEKFKKVTTCRNYTLTVSKFIQCLLDESPSSVRVGAKRLKSFKRMLTHQMKVLETNLAMHRASVLTEKKVNGWFNRKPYRHCFQNWNKTYPMLYRGCFWKPKRPGQCKQMCWHARCLFVYHHWSQSMCVGEFRQCEKDDYGLYPINIMGHKTKGTFEHAKLAVTENLSGSKTIWGKSFLFIKGRKQLLFFFGRSDNMVRHGALVTKACAMYASRKKISVWNKISGVNVHWKEPMCYSVETTNRFYVAECNLSESHVARNFLQVALGLSKSPRPMVLTPQPVTKKLRVISDGDVAKVRFLTTSAMSLSLLRSAGSFHTNAGEDSQWDRGGIGEPEATKGHEAAQAGEGHEIGLEVSTSGSDTEDNVFMVVHSSLCIHLL